MKKITSVHNLVIVALLLIILIKCTEAQTLHVVGGNLGWRVPSDKSAYQAWAAGQNFSVGDILMFNFTTNQHDVYEVSKETYESCNNSENPIRRVTNGPANITIDRTGQHYYLCSINGHCNGGQKLAINVSNGGCPSPADSPTYISLNTPSFAPTTIASTSAFACFLFLFFSTFMDVMF